MTKATALTAILSAVALVTEGARFDSESKLTYEQNKKAGELLKYATQSNRFGNQRAEAGLSGGMKASASVNALGEATDSTLVSAVAVNALSENFFTCPDSKLVPGGCPTDVSSREATCDAASVIVPGITKRTFCPTSCDSCEWSIRPKAEVDLTLPHCITATQGGMLPCVPFDHDIDFKLYPRDANGKVYWSVISSQNNFCLQDLSQMMRDDNTLVKELTRTAGLEDENEVQTLTDKAVQDADENPLTYFGPCISGKFEERQQWQMIQSAQPNRHILRNRRTNKCLHLAQESATKPFTIISTAECTDRMDTKATAFYNQALILTPKPKRFVLQQTTGAMRCVAAPLLGSSKPAPSLSSIDCLLTADQGNHVFNLNPLGSCQVNSTGETLCPYQVILSSVHNSKHCLVATRQTDGSFYPTMASCAVNPTTAIAVPYGFVQAPFAGELQRGLNQTWWLKRASDNAVNKFQFRFLDNLTGKELCLTYAAASQGSAGIIEECSKTQNPSDWTVRNHVAAEKM